MKKEPFRITYLPGDDLSLDLVRRRIELHLARSEAPLMRAALEFETDPGREDESEASALNALQRMIPVGCAAWSRVWGGVDTRPLPPGGDRYRVNTLALEPM